MQDIEVIECDFETFDPRRYLREYYQTVDFENEQLLRFFIDCYSNAYPRSALLEFGIGPTLYSLITAATKIDTIHVCDRLGSNLHEIQLWQKDAKDAFNWDAFIQRALELEGNRSVTQVELQRRARLLRSKLMDFSLCDAFRHPPLQEKHFNAYDIVQVNFVPESITSSLIQWESALWNILSLLKPQGTLILTALKNATYYHVQEKKFPAVSIDEYIVIQALKKFGFSESDILIQTIPASLPYRGYSGIMLIKASSHH